MQCNQFKNREELYRALLLVVETADCDAVAKWVFHIYIDMTNEEETRFGWTDEDENLFNVLMAMDAGEEFWYSKEELVEIIERYID